MKAQFYSLKSTINIFLVYMVTNYMEDLRVIKMDMK